MSEQKYFKITNFDEKHHGFQYCDGLNVLIGEFNEHGKCCAGGLYFTDIEHIHYFLDYGIWLRDIHLPMDDPEFKMVEDPSGGKWRVNKIILGEKRNLYELETLEYLKKQGASFKHPSFFRLAFQKDDVEIFEYLLKMGCVLNSNKLQDCLNFDLPKIREMIIKNKIFTDMERVYEILDHAVYINNVSYVKLILLNYPNIEREKLLAKATYAWRCNHMECFEFLLTGTDDFIITSSILYELFNGGHYHILDWLIKENIVTSNEVDFGDANGEVFIKSAARNDIKILDLLSNKVDAITKREALCAAIIGHGMLSGDLDTVKYLIEKFEIDTSNLEPTLVDAARNIPFPLVKYLVETLKVDPSFDDNAAVKNAQRHKNKKVAKYLARTSSVRMKSRSAQFASANTSVHW